jgi:hypothetical protein
MGYVRFIKEEGQTALRFHQLSLSASQRMMTTNLAFVEWVGIFGSDRLTGALLTDLPTGVISKRRRGKVTDFARPGKDLLASIRQASNQGYTPE